MTVNYKQATVPTLFITKNKQRVKQYNKTVYLTNGDEFELELFNPTSKKVLAKITLNDISLRNGIILRPGERVFLERYLDEAKKFIFETYSVDKNNKEVLDAIKDNGKVEVEFFEEYTNQIVWGLGYSGPTWYSQDNSGTITCDNSTTFICNTDTVKATPISGNVTYTADVNCNITMDMAPVENIQETGRVEKGSKSNQEFDYDFTQFNTYPTWTEEWKILPISQKVYTKEELKVFCTGCGARRKKDSHKFCPHCGDKY